MPAISSIDDTDGHLLMMRNDGDVFVVYVVIGTEFSHCPEFVLLPARIIEILVEDDNGAGDNEIFQLAEDRSSGGIQIAIDVDEGGLLARMGVAEAGEGVVEPTFD